MLRGFGHQGHDEILKKSLAVTSDGSRQMILTLMQCNSFDSRKVVVRPQGLKVIKIPFYGTLSGSPGVKLKQI